ncbi:MAG: hypothetical protein WBD40_22775 [Tepidisphaeraceae bacterium]
MSTAAPATGNKSQSGYDVARPLGRCAVTGQPIAPDEKFMAALRETPMGFERVDVSTSAWPEFDRKDVVAFWQTIMPKTELKKKLFVDDEVLCQLFERLAEVQEPAKLNFRFVLGLILMRKRMLIYETTRHEGDGGERELWTVRFKGRDDRLDLLNPKLTEEQVGEVSQQLGEILNEEL